MFIGLVLILTASLHAQTAALRPAQLRTEYRVNPVGIDVAEPRLSWLSKAVNPKAKDLKQTAYRIVVTGAQGELWDTGKVESGGSIHIAYKGKPLGDGERASWKVQVWDQAGRVSPWSEAASWSMGLTKWDAQWIGLDEEGLPKNPESPYWDLVKAHWIWFPAGNSGTMSTSFDVPKDRKIKSATCITGVDNSYVLTINGANVAKGSSPLMPDVLDVTAHVKTRSNQISVEASYPRPRGQGGLITVLRIEFTAGPPMFVYSNKDWKNSKDLGAYGIMPWGEAGFINERALAARMLRREFQAAKRVKRAMAYVSGLGLSELYLNGEKVSDEVLSPGLTDYAKRVFYVSHDVTKLIHQGPNAVGLWLGNGRYYAPRLAIPVPMRSFGYPKARLQLEIEYADGSRSRVVTDAQWKITRDGPIRANNEFDGEEYDARKEMAGWAAPGFDAAKWESARVVEGPAGMAVAQMAEPLRVTETLKPVKVTERAPGVWIYDMGQNMVGWCRLRVAGPKGTRLTLRHAETLKADGALYRDNLRSARAADLYILKGGGEESYAPRFTYHGFRYVEVRGPKPLLLEGRVVHDAMTPAGDFSSSSTILNQIHKNIYWGMRGNYRSIPTDCPQRDERMGWLGDRSMVSRSESYLFDVAAFYSKWETDIADAQRPTGSIPDVAPAYWTMYNDNMTWPSTFLFVPGMLYEQYGDLRVIERDYEAMKKWIDYMGSFVKDDLMPRDTYGDWCVPPESATLIHSKDPARQTEKPYIGSAYYYQLLKVMARYAGLVGKPADAAQFAERAGRIQAAFNKKYFNEQTKLYSNGTQTSSILAMRFGLVDEQNRAGLLTGLERKIDQESGGHVGTGLVGAQWLMRTLSDNGQVDLAYKIATQKTYPGWGYMISKGATTIWELWNGDTADPAMNSGNHVMQIGDLGVWLYEYLAGIRSDPEKPGFQHVIIHPYPAGDLKFVKASHTSMYGTVVSSWKREAGKFQLEVTIPPNTTATVQMPDGAIHEAGSGQHTFTSQVTK